MYCRSEGKCHLKMCVHVLQLKLTMFFCILSRKCCQSALAHLYCHTGVSSEVNTHCIQQDKKLCRRSYEQNWCTLYSTFHNKVWICVSALCICSLFRFWQGDASVKSLKSQDFSATEQWWVTTRCPFYPIIKKMQWWIKDLSNNTTSTAKLYVML